MWKWNNRVVRTKTTYTDPTNDQQRVTYTYAIHEAYYDTNGFVGMITQDAAAPTGENIEDLRHSWVMMGEAFGEPILDNDDIPEAGYEKENDPVASALKEREAAIPWNDQEEVEEWEPFDEKAYRARMEEERLQKEKIHSEVFVGTPSFGELIEKLYRDYSEQHLCCERPLIVKTMRKRKKRNAKVGARWLRRRRRSKHESEKVRQHRVDYGVDS